MTQQRQGRGDYLTRSEFEQFERNVSRSFEDIRSALDAYGRKIDDIKSTGTDWKAILAFASLLVTIIGLIGALVAYGINSRIDANQATLARHMELPGHTKEMVKHARHDVELENMARRVTELEGRLRRATQGESK